jgi:DNA-binding transcriptional ArsR family regulator
LSFAAQRRNNEAAENGADAVSIEGRQPTEGPSADTDRDACPDLAGLVTSAEDASTLLKAMGHDGRLTILCHLRTGPKSVTELENLLMARQAIVSQQLARLRLEGLVSARREGQAIFYSLLDPKVSAVIEVLARLYDRTGRG